MSPVDSYNAEAAPNDPEGHFSRDSHTNAVIIADDFSVGAARPRTLFRRLKRETGRR